MTSDLKISIQFPLVFPDAERSFKIHTKDPVVEPRLLQDVRYRFMKERQFLRTLKENICGRLPSGKCWRYRKAT